MKEATRMLGRNYIVNIEMQQLQQLPKKGIFKALYKKKEIALKIEQSRIIFPKKGEVTFFPLDEGKNFEESRSSFQKTTPLMKKTDPK